MRTQDGLWFSTAEGYGGVRLRLCAPSHSAGPLGPVRAFTFGVRVRAHCVNHRLDPTGPLHTPMRYSQRGTLSTHNGVLEGIEWRGMIAVGCVVVCCRHGRIARFSAHLHELLVRLVHCGTKDQPITPGVIATTK